MTNRQQTNQDFIDEGLLLVTMKGKLLGFPIIVMLLLGAVFSFSNDSIVEEWLRNNSVVSGPDNTETLSIQTEEQWIVLVIDFQSGTLDRTNMIESAEEMLIPQASDYFHEMSQGTVSVTVNIHNKMLVASQPLSYYGSDNGVERDSAADGTHMPMLLAEEAITASSRDIDWSKYDLDGDKKVDRLLILHTSVGQETGGNSNRIWSHFTTFQDPVILPNGYTAGHYAMASLGSGHEGFGTAMHEMLHQMGAYDLYPSDGQQSSLWKGVGDWDIMASGNWNDNGRTPALPMSSTMETIGLNTFETLTFDWVEYDNYCQSESIIYSGIDNYGVDYKIPISESEFVWVEYRGGNVYEQSLPGMGLLVSYQDTTIDGYEDNSLNVNNKRPYLKIIEADDNNELLNGLNQGQASDLFSNGSIFGNQGVEIRNHDGVLVDWYAEVIINSDVEIIFKTSSCINQFEIDLPNHAITILPNEPISILTQADISCIIGNNLVSTDGRLVSISPTGINPNQSTELLITFSSAAQHNSKTKLLGNITCGDEIRDINIEILSLTIVPQDSAFDSTIPVSPQSSIDIPIESLGQGSQVFDYKIDGPLSRISDSEQTLRLNGANDILVLDIDPKGLLVNNMIVNGEIKIYDSNGNNWNIDVTLTAESAASNSINDYVNGGQLIGLACIFAALWVFLTMKDSATENQSTAVTDNKNGTLSPKEMQFDAWGRLLDD